MRKLLAALLLASTPAMAQQAAPPVAAPTTRPKLIVAIAVDQLSADLFAQYRNRYTRGFARLLEGQVFPSGYQSHAATETCPGHSTILTGFRPDKTGIIANQWVDQRVGREDKTVYCAEDPSVAGSTSRAYTVSPVHLKVPTLGELMKRADPRSRVVSVAGKDRAAVMMGGHRTDEIWWWDGKTYSSYAGRAVPPVVQRTRDAVAALVAAPQPALPLPGWCRSTDRPVRVGDQVLGQGRHARPAGDTALFRASPAADAAVLALAAGLVQEMRLGRGPAPDLLAIGLSATDYIGHRFGTGGTEMCIQQDQLDQALGGFFDELDALGVDYQVVLTADHGAHDMTERVNQRAISDAHRLLPDTDARVVGEAVGKAVGFAGRVLFGEEGDIWLNVALTPAQRTRALAETVRRARALPQVAAVFTQAELAAAPAPSGPPETWSLLQRARASFDPERSGDIVLLLGARVTPIARPGPGYVETHGSPWDYDRRVPIVFWRKGAPGFEQPLSVETIDIAPTLAAELGVAMPGVDGRCLDLDPGERDSCR
ncbi:alkaline phosphatase family protein [Sphingomonas sp.]|jgi:predicted AlkP superfamily pyrophosphatase or phosphodiesterase|uniref:alkaline phosphatase family protein n=1 Tax=Sphingomonas sp. TaxID=28214 RepID=UPI002D7F541B|nr:alkaline phosphatase family protein [Sphingomonas sp.]HEU0044265.1 alkaline phosphatase family protein [Sphingomonas sp.]